MEIFKDIILVLLPAAFVLYGMFLVVKSFLGKELSKNLLELKNTTVKVALPLRLQAYERLALFLERTAPNNLIRRLMDSSFNVVQFQHFLVSEIRNEFEHNLSQQIYMTDKCWNMIVTAKNVTLQMLRNKTASIGINNASELREAIIKDGIAESHPSTEALTYIKKEVASFF